MNSVRTDLFDRPRTLRYDVNALADVEPLIGGSIFMVLSQESNVIRFSVLRALLWAGLKHEDAGLTLNQVGVLMQTAFLAGRDLTDVMKAVNDGILASGLFKAPKEGAQENPPTATA